MNNFISVLTFNLYMHKGHNGSGKENDPDKLFEKIKTVLEINKPQVLFFQEDMTYKREYTNEKLNSLNYTFCGSCYAEEYKQGEQENYLSNSIYIHNDFLINYNWRQIAYTRFTTCQSGWTDRKTGIENITESPRCATSILLESKNNNDHYLVLTTTHLCGGGYVDKMFTNETYSSIKSLQLQSILEDIEKDMKSEKTIMQLSPNDIYTMLPSIIGGDFNSIHPSIYKSSNSRHLSGDESIDHNKKNYMIDGHKFLENKGLRTYIKEDGYSTKFKTLIDYNYYDPTKLAHIHTDIIDMLDVSDHNAILSKYNLMTKYHLYYKKNFDFLYYKTTKAITDNIHLFKKHMSKLINNNIYDQCLGINPELKVDVIEKEYEETLDPILKEEKLKTLNYAIKMKEYEATLDPILKEEISKRLSYTLDQRTMYLYNLFYTNMVSNNDLSTILNKLFNKDLVKKGTIFLNGFGETRDNILKYYFPEFYRVNETNIRDLIEITHLKTLDPSTLTNEDNRKIGNFDILIRLLKTAFENYNINEAFYSSLYDSTTYKDDPIKSNKVITRTFNDMFNFKRSGGLYTTSCYDTNRFLTENKNLNISLSTKYFGTHAGVLNMIGVYVCTKDCYIYNLYPSNFYQRKLFRRVLTNILSNGAFDYNIDADELAKPYRTNQEPAFVSHSYDCKNLLDKKLYINKNEGKDKAPDYTSFIVDRHCIEGIWDGDNTLHESIVNHFVSCYNYLYRDDHIAGYYSLDNGYDTIIEKTIYSREIVWFNREFNLKPIGLLFKGQYLQNLTDYYRVLKLFIKNHFTEIITEKKIKLTENELSDLTNKMCDPDSNVSKIVDIGDTFIRQYYDNNGKLLISRDTFINLINIVSPELNYYLSQPYAISVKNNRILDRTSPELMNDNYLLRGGNKNDQIYKEKYLKYKNKYMALKNKL